MLEVGGYWQAATKFKYLWGQVLQSHSFPWLRLGAGAVQYAHLQNLTLWASPGLPLSGLAAVSFGANRFTNAPAYRGHSPGQLEDSWCLECVLGAARLVRVPQVAQVRERHS